MTASHILRTFEALPPELQREAADFMEFLLVKWQRREYAQQAPDSAAPGLSDQGKSADLAAIRRAGFGALQGKIWMAEDFDEPLDDFKEYM